MKRRLILKISIALVLILAVVLSVIYFSPEKQSFSKTSLLKLNIPEGGESSSIIKIVNYKDENQNFKVYLSSLGGKASLNEAEFSLAPKEKKEIEVSFKDDNQGVGIYTGELVIEASGTTEKIPVVFGIEDSNYAFAILYDEVQKYRNVYPGGQLGVEVKVRDLGNVVSPTVRAKYSIKNLNDEVLYSDEEDLIIDGSKTLIMNIPKNWEKGYYVLVTEIEYRETTSTAGYLFSVESQKEGWFSSDVRFFGVIILIFLLGILVLIFYLIKARDELLVQLKRQQGEEIRRKVGYINLSKESVRESREAPERKKRKLLELEKIKKRIVEKIRKKQEKQRKRYYTLKKKEKKPKLKSQLERWKTEGYKMYNTEKEVKKITKHGMNRQMKDWEKRGYATGFLKNKENL